MHLSVSISNLRFWHPKPWPFVGTNTKLHMLQFVHSNPEFVRIKARPPRTNSLIKLVHTVDGLEIKQTSGELVVYHSSSHYFQVMSWICLSQGHHANFIILHPDLNLMFLDNFSPHHPPEDTNMFHVSAKFEIWNCWQLAREGNWHRNSWDQSDPKRHI